MPSPVCKGKEVVTESEGKKDHAVNNGRNHHHGAHLKRTKPSLASLEKFQEQLKAVKRKVCIWPLLRVMGEAGPFPYKSQPIEFLLFLKFLDNYYNVFVRVTTCAISHKKKI